MLTNKQNSFWQKWQRMSDQEKTASATQFARDVPLSETRALTPAERKQFRRILKRGRGRPRIGKGAKRINITIEKGLLTRVNAFAKRQNISRARIIAEGLELVMKKAG